MILIIVRHGESEADLLGVHEGRADYRLTNLGQDQAKKLALWLKDHESFDYILSSPLIRARQTAQAIEDATRVTVTYDDSLMEWDNGLLAGMDRLEAQEKYPLPPGGRRGHHEMAKTESTINFRARAELFLSKLTEDYGAGALGGSIGGASKPSLCLVSHGGMINMLYRAMMGFPVNTENTIRCADTCVHKFELRLTEAGTIESCRIHYLNRTDHLNY